MYSLIVSPRAQKQLKKIKHNHQIAIKMVLQDITDEPLIGKPLTRELSGRFSYRIGLYRVIYKIDIKDRQVLILSVGHRGTVYN